MFLFGQLFWPLFQSLGDCFSNHLVALMMHHKEDRLTFEVKKEADGASRDSVSSPRRRSGSQFYKTFYVRNSQIFIIIQSVCPRQAFPN
jgi:hypothetical protein